jgi:outer membrane protein OmpA-like peptidoglycan-associated protein
MDANKLGAALLLSLCLCATTARAQDTQGRAFSLETFRPAVDSKGLVSVNASQTLAHLDYSIGFSGSYANRTLSLADSGVRFDVEHLVTMQLQAAIGLFGGPRWYRRMHGISLQLGVTLPVHIMWGSRAPGVVFADPNYNQQLSFSGQSIGDVGVNLKIRFLDTSHHPVGLALLLAADFPSGRADQFLGEGQTTFRPHLIVDSELGRQKRVHLSLDVGVIVRASKHGFIDEGTTLSFMGPDAPNMGVPFCAPVASSGGCGTGVARALGTQLTYGVGLAYAVVPQRFDLVGEIAGGADLTGGRTGLPLEARLAAKVYLAKSSFFLIGAGAGLLPPRIAGGVGNMIGQPLFRVFVGFTFEPSVGDRDHDGIKDDVDLCPDDPETYNDFNDEDGCPDEKPLPPPPPPRPAPPPEPPRSRIVRVKHEIKTFEKVYFKTASAEILPISFPLLDDIVELLNTQTDITLVEIAGHADERGNDDYNLRLTKARSESVRTYLVEHGIAADRLIASGYGETQPAIDAQTQKPCLEHNERCWEKNRRVEFRILQQGEGEASE